MNALTDHVPFFHLLLTTHKQQKQALLKSASKSQIAALCEILLNIVTRTLALTPTEEKYVKGRQRTVKAILKKTTPTKKKQDILSKNLKLVNVVLTTILNQMKNGNEDSAEVHSNPSGEIQEDE